MGCTPPDLSVAQRSPSTQADLRSPHAAMLLWPARQEAVPRATELRLSGLPYPSSSCTWPLVL